MNSALDALVEEWVPAMRAIRVKLLTAQFLERAEHQEPEAAKTLTDELRERLAEAIGNMISTDLPKLERLQGSGIERYEARLRQEGLGAPRDRPIPEDLERALTELGGLRDVLIHRAARVDAKALKQAPSLRYRDGELVRISHEEYRTYSAAVRCYADEIRFRVLRNWPEVTDEHGPHLADWRQYVYLLA
jgi:hypothetical protein